MSRLPRTSRQKNFQMKIYVSKNGQQDGPYGIEKVKQLLAEGTLSPEDLAFFDNCKEWTTISQVPGIEDEDSQNLESGSSFGQYKVTRPLGQGGMGEVYEVVHEVLGTRHALKLLSSEVMEVPGALERFEREAKVMARLKHPGIVGVDDFGETEDRYWLRMELMEGRELNGRQVVTLEEYLKAKGGRLPEEEAKSILKEILQALAHAHEKGLVHQDLKPANILFHGEQIKISDFGLVNAAGADWMNPQTQTTVLSEQEEDTMVDSSSTTSRSRAIMGTFSFMSPEQKLGQPADHRSDLFAIGLIAFRLFTDKTPGFKAPSDMVEGLSGGWDNWLQRALEHEPVDRFADSSEMARALDFPTEAATGPSGATQELEKSDVEDELEDEPADNMDTAVPATFEGDQQEPPDPSEESSGKIPRKVSIIFKNLDKLKFISKLIPNLKKVKVIPIAAGAVGILVILMGFLFIGQRSPDNPEDLAAKALQVIADDDLESFLAMTTCTLTLSEWEEVFEDLCERHISHLEKEMEKATEKSEKRKLEDDIEDYKQKLEYDLEYISLSLYLTRTIDELDYEKWKDLNEDYKASKINALEEKIEIVEDSKKATIWKQSLTSTKAKTFGKADYNAWKENTDGRKESWENAIEEIRKDGKDIGINWDDVEFEYVDFDNKDREEVDDYRIDLAFSYRDKSYKIRLGDCTDTTLGILINRKPRGPTLIE